MRRLAVTVAMGVLGAAVAAFTPARADPPAPPPAVSLTIYNGDIALVQEVRSIELKPGANRVEFKDVSGQIRPETVSLIAPGASVLEQNFDYDLLTPAKMMEKAVGKQIRIVRFGAGGKRTEETATVLSVNDGVILKVGDRIEVLHDGGEPTQVLFDSIPENLRAQPTLSVTLQAAQGGRRDATLSYLTGGFGWRADYVALFDETKGVLDLQGWITLNNSSGVTYRDARTQLVAGTARLSGARQEYPQARGGGVISGGTAPGGANTLADYYLYTLPLPVTVANNQTKQVGFMNVSGVKASKVYHYDAWNYASDPSPGHARVMIDFSNGGDGVTPLAMPAGALRVYVRDQKGEPKFIGESRIGHTPAGSSLSVEVGDAFDVTAKATVVSSEKITDTRTRYAMSYSFRNARAEPVEVAFSQRIWGTDARVEKESLKSVRIDATTLGWTVAIPANGETVLTYTVDVGR